MPAKERALVTGATGFVGKRLAARLLELGWDVALLVREGSRRERLQDLPGPQIHQHDGTMSGAMRILREARPQFVFHLAALSLAEHTVDDVDDLVRSNVMLGVQLAEAMTQTGSPYLINTGTFWQFYEGDDRYDPVCLYAATKQALEDLLCFYSRTGRIRVLNLRLTDTYGPADPRGRLLQALLDWHEGAEPLALTPGEQALDLLHVDDAVAAYLHAAHLLATKAPDLGASYFASTGRLTTVRELVRIVEAAKGRKVEAAFGKRDYRAREVMKPRQEPRLPGWSAQISLEDGIRQMLAQREEQ